MLVERKVIVVTGAARGIGEAMVRRFAEEGAAAIAVADMDLVAASELCSELTSAGTKAIPFKVDVGDERQIEALIDAVEGDVGPIDLFCSNAGTGSGKGLDASDSDLNRNWTLNVLSHVYAARRLVPRMVARGGGYLLNTCSGAGLLAKKAVEKGLTTPPGVKTSPAPGSRAGTGYLDRAGLAGGATTVHADEHVVGAVELEDLERLVDDFVGPIDIFEPMRGGGGSEGMGAHLRHEVRRNG